MQAENAPTTRISVGRDVNGQLIVGDGNVVRTGGSPDPAPTPHLHQQNTANDHATVYSAANGDIHIHHHGEEERDGSDDPPTRRTS